MSFIRTYSGRDVDIENFTIDDVIYEDIEHVLSYLCRYNGHVPQFYSVAEHSINVAKLILTVTDDIKMYQAALLHDASEVYITDIPRPHKHLVPEFIVIDKHIQKTIDYAFGLGDLTDDQKKLIKEADTTMLRLELRELMDYNGEIVDSINITTEFDTSVINFDHEWYPSVIKKMFNAAFRGDVLL